MALKGTGSVDVMLDRLFVPDELAADPLAPPVRGRPHQTVLYPASVAGENLGFTIGVCQRFLDELAVQARTMRRGPGGALADRGAFHYEFGKGQLQVDAARAHGLKTLADADAACVANGALTPAEHQDVMAMLAFATETAVDAVNGLFRFAGAGALFSSNILQRCFRDANGSAQHQVASNIAFDDHGRRLLGEPDRD